MVLLYPKYFSIEDFDRESHFFIIPVSNMINERFKDVTVCLNDFIFCILVLFIPTMSSCIFEEVVIDISF